jgi:hypothetical protein
MKKKSREFVVINYDNIQGIKKAEKKVNYLQDQGYNILKTYPVGFNRFVMEFGKKLRKVV